MRPLAIASLLVAALAIQTGGQTTSQPHAQVSLYADTSTVVPGQPFTVAVAFKLDDGWHTYFKEPGDSGMPPEVKWNLPAGLTAGELQFPKPEVLKTKAGTDYVYEGEVWLLTTITPAADFKSAGAIDLSAAVNWLECDANRCLPGKANVTISLSAGDKVMPTHVEQFESWRVQVKQGESFDPATAR